MNTTLKCNNCGQYIKTNEGFVTKYGKHYHYNTCEKPLKPDQCKSYEPPKEQADVSVFIPSRERSINRKAGFSYETKRLNQ